MCLSFKNITQNDINKIMPYFNLRSNKTCDSVFLDVFLWKDYYNVKYAIKDKTLYLIMNIDEEVVASLPICSAEDLKTSLDTLTKYFNEVLNKKLKIFLADENAVNLLNIDKNLFNVYELEDAKDYLYEAEALKNLTGKKLRKKKNHINAFLKENSGNFEYKTLTCQDKEEVWEFLLRWRLDKGENVEEHLDGELNGIKSILDNCHLLKISMAGVYINKRLEAFTVGSYNDKEEMAIIHIEKANPQIRGLYPFINQQFIINSFPKAKLINREDDLGIEGLRKAKLSYCLVDYARKYRIIQI